MPSTSVILAWGLLVVTVACGTVSRAEETGRFA
jgi:hypothetical protein